MMLVREYFYYTAHQEGIIDGHLGEYVVIKNTDILGYYSGILEALDAMAEKNLELGTFMVHKCRPVGEPDCAVADIDYEVVPAWKH
jgi:hypothetical protein